VPHIRRVGVLLNPDNLSHAPALKAMEGGGQIAAAGDSSVRGDGPRPVCPRLFDDDRKTNGGCRGGR
jgi:hypothetical protein